MYFSTHKLLFNMKQLKYYLQHYAAFKNLNNHAARVQTNGSLDLNAIISHMQKRGCTVTVADTKAVLDLFFCIIAEKVSNGYTVNSPLANFRPSIRGTFKSADDSVDSSRHHCRATISQGAMLGKIMQDCTVVKIDHSEHVPIIRQFRDVVSNTFNRDLRPGGIGQITGDDLKFNQKKAEEGVFFVDTTGEETRGSLFANHADKKLTFSIPKGLTAGDYVLEVRRIYTKNGKVHYATLARCWSLTHSPASPTGLGKGQLPLPTRSS